MHRRHERHELRIEMDGRGERWQLRGRGADGGAGSGAGTVGERDEGVGKRGQGDGEQSGGCECGHGG